ncbi:unnamed protein product [Coffea canephora]|uniref:DH200=94 genomic scaffold, scaffold_164 n=1 Tax=Coffea canephora TaxID=49390 RepID=A0A068V9Z6_COFCA|nr:unnamed protein product [Coffea canephora]
MSSQSSSSSENSFDAEELFQFRTRCKELREEKDKLKDSQSQSFELIRRLELHVKTLSEAQTEDKKRIEQLERELNNSSQEIDYLQDQLNARNTEAVCLDEQVCSLQLKLANMEILEEEVIRLREESRNSNFEHSFLMQELENKEVELQKAILCIDKLEESISSAGLDYQCEIESMKLDLLALEQKFFQAKKLQEETALENARMNNLIQDLRHQLQDEKKTIQCLGKENKDLTLMFQKSKMDTKVFCQKVEEQFQGSPVDKDLSLSELGEDIRTCGEILGPLPSKLVVLGDSDAELREKMYKMSHQVHQYELLVERLKEEVKEEKLKAKEEAEDLAQEMAELRYQITGLLEDERKRRACVEQISLRRIAELEAALEKERSKGLDDDEHKKSITVFRHMSAA